MPCYFIANIKLFDEEEYNKYLAKCDEIFSKYNGKYIFVKNNPEVIEGNWNYDRVVLIEFSNKKDFNDWYHSKEYQNVLKNRLKGAICDSIIVES